MLLTFYLVPSVQPKQPNSRQIGLRFLPMLPKKHKAHQLTLDIEVP